MLFSAAKFQNLQQEQLKIPEMLPFHKMTDWCDCGFESFFCGAASYRLSAVQHFRSDQQ